MIDIESNEQIVQRRAKLQALREKCLAYPNDFQRDALAAELHQRFTDQDEAELTKQSFRVKVAGTDNDSTIDGQSQLCSFARYVWTNSVVYCSGINCQKVFTLILKLGI